MSGPRRWTVLECAQALLHYRRIHDAMHVLQCAYEDLAADCPTLAGPGADAGDSTPHMSRTFKQGAEGAARVIAALVVQLKLYSCDQEGHE